MDTKLLASGSDDARVKLWSANINHSVASLEAKVLLQCIICMKHFRRKPATLDANFF